MVQYNVKSFSIALQITCYCEFRATLFHVWEKFHAEPYTNHHKEYYLYNNIIILYIHVYLLVIPSWVSQEQVATQEDDHLRLATPRVNCRRVILTETLPENCMSSRDDQGPYDPRLGLGSLRVGASGAHLVSRDTNLGHEDPWVMHHDANEGLRDARVADVGSSSMYDRGADVGPSSRTAHNDVRLRVAHDAEAGIRVFSDDDIMLRIAVMVMQGREFLVVMI